MWRRSKSWELFSSNLSYASNTEKRTQACRKAMYSLVGVGCTYPGGLSSDAKTYLWKSVGLPSLLYNLESTSISDICMRQVEKAQSSTVKRLLGFPQPSHHSNILRALNLSKVQSHIDKATLSLWYRIFQVDSPTRLLCAKLLSDIVLYDYSVPRTLIDRIIKMKLSPVKCLFRRVIPNVIEEAHHDGVVENLRFLILHENFIKPNSSELGVNQRAVVVYHQRGNPTSSECLGKERRNIKYGILNTRHNYATNKVLTLL